MSEPISCYFSFHHHPSSLWGTLQLFFFLLKLEQSIKGSCFQVLHTTWYLFSYVYKHNKEKAMNVNLLLSIVLVQKEVLDHLNIGYINPLLPNCEQKHQCMLYFSLTFIWKCIQSLYLLSQWALHLSVNLTIDFEHIDFVLFLFKPRVVVCDI